MDTTFIAFVALAVFMGLMLYLRSHYKILGALDSRSKEISSDLDNAVMQRETAELDVTEQKRKSAEVGEQAKGVLADARSGAEKIMEEANRALLELTARRTQITESRIAMLEELTRRAILTEIVDMAVLEATEILQKEEMSKDLGKEIIINDLAMLKSRLN